MASPAYLATSACFLAQYTVVCYRVWVSAYVHSAIVLAILLQVVWRHYTLDLGGVKSLLGRV